MKKLLLLATVLLFITILSGAASAQSKNDLPDWQYYGYKIVHHMGAVVGHIEQIRIQHFRPSSNC